MTEANEADASGPVAGPVDIGGNLEAGYDAAAKTVTLRQKTGTVLDAGGAIAAYVVVKITDASRSHAREMLRSAAREA